MPDCLLPFTPLWSRVSPFIYQHFLHSLVCMLYLQLQTKMQLSFLIRFYSLVLSYSKVLIRFLYCFIADSAFYDCIWYFVWLFLLRSVILLRFVFCGCCTSTPEEWIACLSKCPGQIASLMNHIIFIFTPKRLLFLPDAFAEPNMVICQSAWTICFAKLCKSYVIALLCWRRKLSPFQMLEVLSVWIIQNLLTIRKHYIVRSSYDCNNMP